MVMGFIHLQQDNEVLAVLKLTCLSVDKLLVLGALERQFGESCGAQR